MQNIIIGTAGHVDHGKTFLIKALTGVDTDRLKEEKKRGITIENGFASLNNDLDLHIGIIDVPGHEKFVRNMLAGIGGIDIVLLVISLEEGVKPQTVEHFEIVKSLGIKNGIIVYTKMDSENQVNFDELEEEVKNLLLGSNLENAKSIKVSSFTGENIDELKNMIFELAKNVSERNIQKELTRLPIDRVFVMEGFGTVITGTLMEGKIDTGDELMVYPYQKVVKVRQIQSFGKVVPSIFAGQRTAINLLNVKKEELIRGDVLATKSSILLSDIIDCKIKMFKSVSRKIKNGERVFFNFGSRQIEANAKIISDEYIQFKFEKEIPVKRGDKYIVRFLSPQITCGGGIILNIESKRYKIENDIAINHFKAIDSNDNKIVLLEMINDASVDFPSPLFLSKKMNEPVDVIKKYLYELYNNNDIVVINSIKAKNDNKYNDINDNSQILSNRFFEGTKKYIIDILNKYHKENPIMKGMKKEELKGTLFKRYTRVGDTAFEDLINYMIENKILNQAEDLVSNAEFKVVIDENKAKEFYDIEKKYIESKYEPPLTDDIVEEFSKGKPSKYKLQIRQILVDLQKDGKIVKLSNEYYIHKTHLDKVIEIINNYFETHEQIKMAELRDLLSTSRKYALIILEWTDAKKITKRVGDYRIKIK